MIKEQYPLVKFSSDDTLAFLHTKPEEIRVLSPPENFKPVQSFEVDPCDYIVVSCLSTSEIQIARVIKHNESNEVKRLGRLIVSTYPTLYDHELDQTFARAHEIKLEWAPSGRTPSSPR